MKIVIAEFGEELQQQWNTLREASPLELSAFPKIYLAPPGEVPAVLPGELVVRQVSQVYNATLGYSELVVIFQPDAADADKLMPYAVLSTQDPAASTAARKFSRVVETWFMDNPGPHAVSCAILADPSADDGVQEIAEALISGFNAEMQVFQQNPKTSMDV